MRMLSWRRECRSAATVLGLLLAASVSAASEPAAFGDLLAARYDDLRAPGVGYAVVADGDIVEAGGVGVQDIHDRAPVTADTPFRLASLTKPLAAALLLSAVEDGRLDLDMPLRRASPRFAERCPALKAHFKARGSRLMNRIACDDDSVTLRTAATHTSRRPAGAAYRYNGFLFSLMSGAIATAIRPGASFAEVVRSELIVPLGLRHTAAGIDDRHAADVIAALAPPHVRDADGAWRVGPPLTGRLSAAAGLIGSARDLARIDIAFRPGGLVTPAAWTRMTTPTVLAGGGASPYGIGWFVQDLDGRRLVWHYGWQIDSYSALWIKDLAHATSLILLANSDGLSRGHGLSRGDIWRSPVARWFLDWSADRAAAAGPVRR